MRHDEDVREQDRGVEAEAPDRLQRDLGGAARVVAEIEERAGLGAQLAVFREIAAGLAHEPDRRRPDRLAAEHAQNRLRRTLRVTTSSL